MRLNTTNVFSRNIKAYNTKKRRALNQGGTSSSKTISILQLLYVIAYYTKEPLLISIVSESMPHLKRGCIRDFKNVIMQDMWNNNKWNATDCIYSASSNGTIEFFSADDATKLRGGRRDILYINECNNISFDAFNELDIRTRLFTFLDWNPTHEFWANEMQAAKENVFIHSTYKDALDVLPEDVVKNIESRRLKDPNWWRVYGEGLVGKIEGLVYPNFTIVTTMPENYSAEIFGLDFGFSTDPTALVRLRICGDELYCEEMVYKTGMTNSDLAHCMESVGIKKGHDEIICDSAEPRTIEELYRAGYNAIPCNKGHGSVEYGHQKVNQYKQFWTKNSLNGIREQRNFMYIPDKNGKLTEKTNHYFSHLLDARRYAVDYIENRRVPKLSI